MNYLQENQSVFSCFLLRGGGGEGRRREAVNTLLSDNNVYNNYCINLTLTITTWRGRQEIRVPTAVTVYSRKYQGPGSFNHLNSLSTHRPVFISSTKVRTFPYTLREGLHQHERENVKRERHRL